MKIGIKSKSLIIAALLLLSLVITYLIIILYLQSKVCTIRVYGTENKGITIKLNEFLKINHVGNAAIALGVMKGEKASEYFYGIQSYPFGKRTDKNTIYEIGSITKTFTAALIQKEIIDGKIKLDDAMGKYLVKGKEALPQYNNINITIRDLLSHTSQLPKDPSDYTDPKYFTNPYRHYTVDSIYAFLKDVRLSAEPGSSYSYSNFGYVILGEVLTAVTGKTYDDLLNEEILSKLDMNDTSLSLNQIPKGNIAQGYAADGKRVDNWEFGAFASAGGIYTDLSDIMKWLGCNINPDNSDLNEVLTESHKIIAKTPDMATAGFSMASAWNVRQVNDITVFEQGGWDGGYRTEMVFSPQKEIGMVLLTPCSGITFENTLAFSFDVINILANNE